MAQSTLIVEISDRVSPSPPEYEVSLELNESVARRTITIDEKTSFGTAEFPLDSSAAGRITVEKGSQDLAFPLQDVFELDLSVRGTAPTFKVEPSVPQKPGRAMPFVFQYTPSDNIISSRLKLTAVQYVELCNRDATQPSKGPVLSPCNEQFRPTGHLFPAESAERRALVLSGVHGSEPEGVRAVENVLTALRAGWTTPFTTIVVPVIIPRTQPTKGGHTAADGKRNVRSLQEDKPRDIEPNRNFPLAGQSLSKARLNGRTSTEEIELLFRKHPKSAPVPPDGDGASTRFIPETAFLLALIESFRPQRIVSVHSHSIPDPQHKTEIRGNSFGIFVDPRLDPKGNPLSGDDEGLARAMLQEFTSLFKASGITPKRDPLIGNKWDKAKKKVVDDLKTATVFYAASHPTGTSLGGWAPAAVHDTVKGVKEPRGNREGIITVTVELPQGEVDGQDTSVIQRIEDLHAEVILRVFLEASAPS